MNDVSLLYYDTSDVLHTYTDVFRFSVIKDYYLPYTIMSAGAFCAEQPPPPKKLVLKIDDTEVHCGIADRVRFVREAGGYRLLVESKSFTSMLTQNQMTSGLVSDISIGALLSDYYQIPEISCENDTTQANYIYCRKGSTLWNAVENLTQKLYSRYPYVRGNKVMMNLPATPATISVTNSQLISTGNVWDYTRMFSNMHMEDINGTGNAYNSVNSQAVACGIVRHRQLELDRQYLNDPSLSLVHKMNYSNRMHRAKYAEISEAVACDLCDKANAGELSAADISRIEISGANGMCRTRLWAYYDDYCNSAVT